MSFTIEEIGIIIDIIAKRFNLDDGKPTAQDVKNELNARKEISKQEKLEHYKKTNGRN